MKNLESFALLWCEAGESPSNDDYSFGHLRQGIFYPSKKSSRNEQQTKLPRV